jgi:hypothetical protein
MSASGSAWNLVNGSTVGVIETNQWYHIAVYRVGSSIYTSFNGVVTLQNASGGASPQDNSGNWGIGTQPDGTTNPFTGYIADMRFVIGSGVYASTNFTPPSTSLANVTNTKLLTFQTRIGENNQRFIDESGAKALVTRFGNATQGAFTPYSPSGWSGYFDGTGDYLTIPTNDAFTFGTGDFTIEGWMYLGATSSFTLFDNRTGTTSLHPVIYSTGTNLAVYVAGANIITGSALVTNQWYHIALVKLSGSTKLYVNGVQSGSTYTDGNSYATSGTVGIGGGLSAGNLTTGYLSNVRVVKGVAIYTGNFTPPTRTLTVTQSAGGSGSNIAAISNANSTSLLTLKDNRFIDGSGNNFTITVLGDTKILPFSPFRPISVYSPTANGGSVYLDGTGDYLTVASDTITTLGTQDFTIEFWTYVTTLATQITLIDQRTGGSEIVPWITANATTTVFGTVTTNRISGSPLTANQWNHIAVSRFSGNTRLFINGTQSGSTYVDGTTYVSGSIYVGSSYVSSQRVNGYISDFNISKTGKYTTSFTVPSTPITSTGNTLSRLEFDNAALIDYTCKNSIETIGTTRFSIANSKYGTSSISFNTKTDALALPVS